MVIPFTPFYTDKYGNEQVFFQGLWWGTNFERFWQLYSDRDKPPVMICRLCPGERPIFVKWSAGDNRYFWMKRWKERGYGFLEPETQTVLPGQRKINFEEIRRANAPKPVRKSRQARHQASL